jgi:hypothetical protein
MKVASCIALGTIAIACKPVVNSSGDALTRNGGDSQSPDVCLLSPAHSQALASAAETDTTTRVPTQSLPPTVQRIAHARSTSQPCSASVIKSISTQFPSVAATLSKSYGEASPTSIGLVGQGMFGPGVATVEVVSGAGSTYYFGRNPSGAVIETIKLIDHRER